MDHYIYVVSLDEIPVRAFFSRSAANEYTKDMANEIHIDSIPLESFRDYVIRTMIALEKTLPTPKEAQDWMVTEVGEVIDARLQLSGNGKWVRNNPNRHEAPDVDKEIGDVVYMAALATKNNLFQIIDKKLKEKGWRDIS